MARIPGVRISAAILRALWYPLTWKFPLRFGYFQGTPKRVNRRKMVLCCACSLLVVVLVWITLMHVIMKYNLCMGLSQNFCMFWWRLRQWGLYFNFFRVRSDLRAHRQRSRQLARSTRTEKCVLPTMDPYDADIKFFDYSVSPLKCSKAENWVYVENGTLRIADSLKLEGQKKIACDYTPIVRGDGDHEIFLGPKIQDTPDGYDLMEDAFHVSCQNRHKPEERYDGVHLGVSYKADVHQWGKAHPLRATAMGGYDVFFFGFDSVSRMSWMRNLQKTREFFLRELDGIELEGHVILGDGTTQTLLPLFTGLKEDELPSARKDDPRGIQVDNYPWIWRDFEKAGYVTALGEDMPHIGAFTYRLKGFKKKPVDHYMRTYQLAAAPMISKNRPYCAGSEPRHTRFFNYFRDMYHMYGAKRKFMFGFHAELSHENNNHLKMLDADFTAFLADLNRKGYLNHTILILMADHGARFSGLRKTQQGRLEERMPYLGIHFPPGFKAAYPSQVEQLRRNRKRLTTNFDLHETLRDLLDNTLVRDSRTRGRGISLFKPVPESRSCEQAAIEPHYCPCLNWEDVSHNQELKESTTAAVVDFINGLMKTAGDQCETLSVHNVTRLDSFLPRKDVLTFKHTVDINGLVPKFDEDMTLNFELLQLVLITNPGQGLFEVTLKHSLDTGDFTVRAEDISRINKYGNASACVSDRFPNLSKFCYCKQRAR